MSLRHGSRGVRSHRRRSGYDLKKAFDGSVRHFWPADQSQIYRTLTQLVDDGLVERAAAPGEKHRDRFVYTITAPGRADLHTWLAAPLPPAEREPFLIQVFFADNLPGEAALRLLEQQRDDLRAQYGFYDQLFGQMTAANPGAVDARTLDARALFYRGLTLEYVLAIGQAYLRWLDAAIDRARREEYAPRHPDQYNETEDNITTDYTDFTDFLQSV